MKSADGYYYVENSTLSWMQSKLTEGKDHRDIVRSFNFSWDQGSVFEIIPIFQGQAGLTWDLYLKLGDDEYKLWSKSEGLERKVSGQNNWQKLINISNTNDQRTDLSSVTAVRAIPIDTRNFIKKSYPDGTKMTFYLKITSKGNSYATEGTEQSSDGKKICLLDCETPSNVPSHYTSYILGCEDATNSCDNDYNDVCFLVTGIVPKVIYEDAEEVETISKRYMIEDLTNVGDFDFNDIVVDVTQKTTTYYKVNTETKVHTKDDTKPAKVEQEATVRWLCGTVPIQVKVGNHTFGRVTAPVEQAQSGAQLMGEFTGTPKDNSSNITNGYQPMYAGKSITQKITGWDPDQNNIEVYVWWNGTEVTNPGNGSYWRNSFPNRNGSVPTMVATDIDEQWPAEGAVVTETSWWNNNFISNQDRNQQSEVLH